MQNEKLPKEFKEKWVQALLSGEYKQGKNFLFKSGRHCCLGVGCRVAGLGTNDILSEYVAAKMEAKGVVLPLPHRTAFADLNDSGVPFEVIAGVINEYL